MVDREKGFILWPGNMFGKKTSHAILYLQDQLYLGKKVQAFRHEKDNRYPGDFITAHGGMLKFPAQVVSSLDNIIESLEEDTDIIHCEEAFLFDERLLKFVRDERYNRIVTATILQNDYRGNPFPLRSKEAFDIDSKKTAADLMGLATTIHQMFPKCGEKDEYGHVCGKDAYFPQRRNPDGTLSAYEDKTIIIGGSKEENEKWGKDAEYSYDAKCMNHFIKPVPLDKKYFSLDLKATRESVERGSSLNIKSSDKYFSPELDYQPDS